MKPTKFSAKIEDFEGGDIVQSLASSHPVYLRVQVNVFSKEVLFKLHKGNYCEVFDNFEESLKRFNELL